MDMPGDKPNVIERSAVFMLVSKTPPSATNFLRLSTPLQERPGRISSVESGVPMFGVSAVFFHGRAFPHIGNPETIACGVFRPAGGKRMASNIDLKFGSRATF